MQTLPLTGLIDRRILLNFRADPAVVARLLPAPFRPQLVQGYAMVGICLIRLRNERLNGLPAFLGLTSENGAHRFAVEWDVAGQPQSGVFIPRRDTSSRINQLVGNLYLGIHHHSHFQTNETDGSYAITLHSPDGTNLTVAARETADWPVTSVFANVEQASAFFRQGAVGYSPQAAGQGYNGVQLTTPQWQVSPLAVTQVSSSYFSNERLFPAGSVLFDNALLMRNVAHSWQRLPTIIGKAGA
ncbi:DUF2071 domain-containing protein [Hymenobacter sp. DH14]|uniref:DUF2071 domain-containing protein n=1 Tax=Hymenobacter cyanobacteriorum TaxID=2926463 RepID=A0A9X1VFB5_9BACT|nr:DUF2071 domain-containing protein [Hymenobacter cyanobacteriorum]MCI1187558.1 DUF2071 domain-containing protein [Hymenobacter cyanobacteriorum]